ncbi:MAG: hypothetical protein ABL959_19125 [Pyrinomonadaceae bacterium]
MKRRNILGGSLSLFALLFAGIGCNSLKPSNEATSNTSSTNKSDSKSEGQPNSNGEYIFTAEKYCSQFDAPPGMEGPTFKKAVSAKFKDKTIIVSTWMDSDVKEQNKYKKALDQSIVLTVKCGEPPYNSPTFSVEFDTASMAKPEATKLIEKLSGFTKNQPVKLKCVGAGEDIFFQSLRKCSLAE